MTRPPVTRLLFVRHGESHHSLDGVIGGPEGCRGLTDRGRAQAGAVGLSLAGRLGGTAAAVYSSVLPRAVETADAIGAALGTAPVQHCGLCTWHLPPHADGMRTAEFQDSHAAGGGGVFRPFEHGNETWAELVARTGSAITEIAQRHAGGTAVLVGHSETVESSFHVLGGQPLYRAFDLKVAPASVTEWSTDGDPSAWPPARWTLHCCGGAEGAG
ncbi:histidine phosphatase family protein [Paractinoplanes rishiriensis]|uniref:histidine phosphatase family protein n=1 Tax=Paractinoplanes rishiriensis TaxID=1050105 RepID=UPI001EF1CF01|nr:histidine phosphatase family protein [Actinoplanes rishiriensis]